MDNDPTTENNETIEILILTEADIPARPLTVSPEITIDELLRLVVPQHHELFVIVVEEEDAPRERHHRLHECGIKHQHRVHCHPKQIHYTVDMEAQETSHHRLTPVQIMSKANVDSKTHYLIRLIGRQDQESYKDKPEEQIHLHNGMKFTTASLEPVTVS